MPLYRTDRIGAFCSGWIKTVSNRFLNCFVSVSFQRADSCVGRCVCIGCLVRKNISESVLLIAAPLFYQSVENGSVAPVSAMLVAASREGGRERRKGRRGRCCAVSTETDNIAAPCNERNPTNYLSATQHYHAFKSVYRDRISWLTALDGNAR